MDSDFIAIAGLALMFLLGGAFALVYTTSRLRRFRHLARLATATGQVVRVSRNNDGVRTTTVEYQNAQGMTLVAICSLGEDFAVGSTVTVGYDPFGIAEALVKEDVEKGARGGKIVVALFAVLGAVLLAVAIVGYGSQ